MINYDLSKIRAIVFDVDGVLSSSTVPTDGEGEPLRTVNIKDGYAIQLARKMGMHIGDDIFMGCAVKIETWNGFLEAHGLSAEEVIYVGDDIPDYEVMLAAAVPAVRAMPVRTSRQSQYMSATWMADRAAGATS